MSEVNVYLWDQKNGAFHKWSIHIQWQLRAENAPVEGAGSSFNSGC